MMMGRMPKLRAGLVVVQFGLRAVTDELEILRFA